MENEKHEIIISVSAPTFPLSRLDIENAMLDESVKPKLHRGEGVKMRIGWPFFSTLVTRVEAGEVAHTGILPHFQN